MYDLERAVKITVTSQELSMLTGAVQRVLRYCEQHYREDGGATHSPEEYATVRQGYGELLWRLDTASVPSGTKLQHSKRARRPRDAGNDDVIHLTADDPSVAAAAGSERQPALWDGHSFHVERLLPDGRSVSSWSSRTQLTREFRAACSCGWSGQEIVGDQTTGREDDDSREAAYDYWDRHHVPGYEERSPG